MAAFVSRYASAFADVVTSSGLNAAEVDRQLGDFLATWNASSELRICFANPAISATEKVKILDKMNARLGLEQPLRNLLAVLINHDRIAQVEEVVDAWRVEVKQRQGIRKAEIVTARAIDAAERGTLIAGVGKLAGSKIEASFKLDASILGGAVVRIGSTVYDGSVRGRLNRLKELLVAS